MSIPFRPAQAERWFYLDRFDANEFCPLWRDLDWWSCRMDPPRNWCLVHYEAAAGFATINVPSGDFYPPALDRVNEAVEAWERSDKV